MMGWDFAPSPEQWEAIRAPLAAGRGDRGGRLGQDHADGGAGGLPRRHRAGPARAGARADLHHEGRRPAADPDPRGAVGGRAAPPSSEGDADDDARADGRDVQRLRRQPARPTTACGSATSPTPGCSPTPPATSSARAWSTGTRGEVAGSSPTTRPTAIQNLLALDSAMSEHLVDARAGARPSTPEARRLRARDADGAGRQGPQDLRRGHREGGLAIDRRRELLDLVRGYRRLKRDARADGLLRPDRARGPTGGGAAGGGRGSERERFRVVLLDEYQDTSVAQAHDASRG